MADMGRLFVAVDIGPEARASLAACGRSVAKAFPGARWVRPETMHLTVRFLGDTPLDRAEDLGRILGDAVRGWRPFSCRLRGVGVFPDVRRPVVVWAGVGEGREALTELAQNIRDALQRGGFGRDPRPFAAHVTLARIPRGTRVDPRAVEAALDAAAPRNLADVPVRHVALYRSVLTPAGARYQSLWIGALGHPDPAAGG
ncbi:MAG: RNA 2',3'-cyclic phosphodiesterase [Lentisphaeria bacterium]|nr:RNA 2',3'-cyclic phosphodiesterase [Lentisphaeria bacterium]